MQKVAHFLVTCFLYLSAILMLLFAAVPHFASAIEVLLKLHSYTFFFFDQMNDIIFAMALMGLARGISAKVQRAFWPTVAVLGIGIVNTVYQTKSLSLAFFLGLVLLFVWLSRKELYRQQLQYSLGKMVADVVIFAGVFILYAIVGIINNVMNLLSLNSFWQQVVKGIVILIAVLLDIFTRNAIMRSTSKQG